MLSQQRWQQPHTTVSPLDNLPQHLDAKLGDLVKQEHGLKVVLLSTVSYPLSSSSSANSRRAAEHPISENTTPTAPPTILHWLQHKLGLYSTSQTPPTSSTVHSEPTARPDTCSVEEDTSIAERFWSLSPHLLASIAAQSLDFFRTYFKLLTSRVNKLQEDVVREFENREDTDQNKHTTHLEKLENDTLPHFQALFAVDPNVRDVTFALVTSQVEETAAKVLTVATFPTIPTTTSGSGGSGGVVKHPVNLWREVVRNLNVLHGSHNK
jgi:hypothetical protein